MTGQEGAPDKGAAAGSNSNSSSNNNSGSTASAPAPTTAAAQRAGLAQALQDLARGERAASQIEAQLDQFESKMQELLNSLGISEADLEGGDEEEEEVVEEETVVERVEVKTSKKVNGKDKDKTEPNGKS